MQSGRRGFFGTILGGAAAAELLANVPEPSKVERIEPPLPSEKSVFVMTFAGYLEAQAYQHIQQVWKMAFAPDPAPKLLILEEGMTLQQMVLPKP